VTQDPADPAIYAVGGTPATSVLLGVTGILGADRRPDLVVSGTNDGANLGPATVISGTVGATIVALQNLEPPIPGIAISTDRRVASEPVTSPANVAHFEQVADFLARLVAVLQADGCRKGQILPAGLALNINYPPLHADDVQGVVLAEQGQASFFAIGYAQVAPGVFAPKVGALDPVDDVNNSDTAWFREGFVTVVPIDGNYTAPPGRSASLKRALKHLEP
jgi:5'-nucleotidase